MISQTAEYALRAVACLAASPGSSQTTQQIAAITKVPPSYLSKVLQVLVKSRLVHSQRGLHGGFSLARSAAQISILEVVNAVDPIQHILECPLGLKTHGVNLCPLHRRLNDAISLVENAFRNSSLAEVIAESDAGVPLCEVPPSNPS